MDDIMAAIRERRPSGRERKSDRRSAEEFRVTLHRAKSLWESNRKGGVKTIGWDEALRASLESADRMLGIKPEPGAGEYNPAWIKDPARALVNAAGWLEEQARKDRFYQGKFEGGEIKGMTKADIDSATGVMMNGADSPYAYKDSHEARRLLVGTEKAIHDAIGKIDGKGIAASFATWSDSGYLGQWDGAGQISVNPRTCVEEAVRVLREEVGLDEETPSEGQVLELASDMAIRTLSHEIAHRMWESYPKSLREEFYMRIRHLPAMNWYHEKFTSEAITESSKKFASHGEGRENMLFANESHSIATEIMLRGPEAYFAGEGSKDGASGEEGEKIESAREIHRIATEIFGAYGMAGKVEALKASAALRASRRRVAGAPDVEGEFSYTLPVRARGRVYALKHVDMDGADILGSRIEPLGGTPAK